jgi:hypothetical protein
MQINKPILLIVDHNVKKQYKVYLYIIIIIIIIIITTLNLISRTDFLTDKSIKVLTQISAFSSPERRLLNKNPALTMGGRLLLILV